MNKVEKGNNELSHKTYQYQLCSLQDEGLLQILPYKCICLLCDCLLLHNKHYLHTHKVDLHTLHLLHMKGDHGNLSLLCILNDWIWQSDEFK